MKTLSAVATALAMMMTVLASTAAGQVAVPLDQAVKDGKVKVEITGLGGSTGDSILLTVRRQVSEPVRLSLGIGTVFKSASASVQNMVAAKVKGIMVNAESYSPTAEILLADDNKRAYIVEAYCMDFHKENPDTQNAFSLGEVDGQAARIIKAGLGSGASINAIQAALWISRDNVSDAKLQQKFPMPAAELQKAHELLQQAAKPADDNVRLAPKR